MWNLEDHRAVVPPVELQHVRDVVYACREYAAASPSAVGFGLYAYHAHDEQNRTPLNIMYVSPAVARDRAKFLKNGGGVISGWYVVVQPPMPFLVKITMVNGRRPEIPQKDSFLASLHVDEHDANYHYRLHYTFGRFTETTAKMILKKREEVEPGVFNFCGQRFSFDRAPTTEQDDGKGAHSFAGSIRLQVQVGKIKALPVSSSFLNWRATKEKEDRKVHAKTAAKEGKSVSVSASGPTETKICHRDEMPKDYVGDREDLPEATIVLHVRERNWMWSRSLVDDDGEPMTFAKYDEFIKSDEAEKKSQKRRADSVILVSETKKKTKRSCARAKDTTETIDLT